MATIEEINASYAQLEQWRNAWGNDPAAGRNYDQQMQALVAERDRIAAQQAAANDAWHKANQNQSSSSSPSSPAPPPPPPAPVYPTFNIMQGSTRNVLTAPSDIIQFDEENVEIQLLQDLLFEDIASVELANISRTDLIDGQETLYSPIKNLSSIRRDFNPNNIILTARNNDYFTRFGIDIFNKTIYEPYFDEDGNLVIEIDGLGSEEEIQVQILSNGTINLVDES